MSKKNGTPSRFMKKLGSSIRKDGKKYSVVMNMELRGIINFPIPIALDITASSQEEAKRKALQFLAEQTDVQFENIRRDDGVLAAIRRGASKVGSKLRGK